MAESFFSKFLLSPAPHSLISPIMSTPSTQWSYTVWWAMKLWGRELVTHPHMLRLRKWSR